MKRNRVIDCFIFTCHGVEWEVKRNATANYTLWRTYKTDLWVDYGKYRSIISAVRDVESFVPEGE